MGDSQVACGIVLAAGGSSRMGSPKALLDLDGEPLICAHLRAMRPHCVSLRVVLGAHGETVSAALPADVFRFWNRQWSSTGPRESLLIGLEGLADEALALVTPVDAPPAPTEVVTALVARQGAAVPCYANQDAHPVLIQVGPARRALATGTLREALATAPRVAVDWPDGLLNLNTTAEWRGWLDTRRCSSPR